MLQIANISKRFGGVQALRDVSFSIPPGECHGLMGENGAGKSTLGKIIAGVHRADAGHILLDGKPLDLHSPAQALRAGIGMVHQELAFCPDLSVAENLCMGRVPRKLGILRDRSAMRDRARSLLEHIGAQLDPDKPMAELSTAQVQLVQIASAVGTGARLLIFDEPTSSLSELDSARLFELIGRLTARQLTCIYVTHRMAEVQRLCDRVSVLRDGQYIGTLSRGEVEEKRLVHMMVGRHIEIARRQKQTSTSAGRVVLKVAGLSSPGLFRDVGFSVASGEIVGMAGLIGAGRSEVAKAIFGLDRRSTGRVEIDGEVLTRRSPRRAMRAGIGFVPEDRKRQGLVLQMSCRRNFALPNLPELSRAGMLRRSRERETASRYFQQVDVRTASIELPAGSLSGGNQQKVVLAKWLARTAKVLIVDEPTRGVDVGAKAAIHQLLFDLASKGLAILMISSELPELLNVTGRILVMREGRLVAEVSPDSTSQDELLRLMSGMGASATS